MNSSDSEYSWWQDYETNDPVIDANRDRYSGGLNRPTIPELTDEDAGFKKYHKLAGVGGVYWDFRNLRRNSISHTSGTNSYGFIDGPLRTSETSSGDINWTGDLYLQKKNAAGFFENVMHVTYGFTIKSNGQFRMTPLRIVGKPESLWYSYWIK